MLIELVRFLKIDDFYGVSENIDIAKGRDELTTSWKKAWEKDKRKRAWQKKS